MTMATPDMSNLHQIPITRFRSFRTQPLENLSAAVKLPIKKGFWATQPLEQILDSEFLLCELGVQPLGTREWDSRPIMSLVANATLGWYGTSEWVSE